jgi:hypothetical protein
LQNTDEADPMLWFCFKGIPDLPAPLRKQLIATRDGAGNSLALPVVVFPSSPLDQQRTARAAPVSRHKRPRQNATNAIKSNENTAKSTNLIDVLPLIAVGLQLRVLPGPPVNQGFIRYRSGSPHQKRRASSKPAMP